MNANVDQLAEQEVISTAIDGIAYGRGVRVLARRGETLLIFVPGQSVWSGTGQPWRYAPSSLMIHRASGRYTRLGSGGRCELRIREAAAAIDREFGDGFHKLLDPKATIVIGSDANPS